MQSIKVDEKKGFYTDGPVEIYDKRGIFLRYDKPTYFNLPAGSYSVTKGQISALEEPVYYEPLQLAIPTKPPINRKVNIKPRHSSEPQKMDIDYQNDDMRINPEWEATLTTPEYEFATRHECGHYFYHADDAGQYNCDRMAADSMLEDGFNPDQIRKASHGTLCGLCAPVPVHGDIPLGDAVFEELGVPYSSAKRRFDLEMEMLETSINAREYMDRFFNPFEGLADCADIAEQQKNRDIHQSFEIDPMNSNYKSRNVWDQIFNGDFGK
jgi:hypothetical protein